MLSFLVQTNLNGAHMHCCTFGSFADSGETNQKMVAGDAKKAKLLKWLMNRDLELLTASFEEIELSNAKKFRNQLN